MVWVIKIYEFADTAALFTIMCFMGFVGVYVLLPYKKER